MIEVRGYALIELGTFYFLGSKSESCPLLLLLGTFGLNAAVSLGSDLDSIVILDESELCRNGSSIESICNADLSVSAAHAVSCIGYLVFFGN